MAVASLMLSLSFLSPALGAATPEPGTSEGGRTTQTGWWSSTNEPPPENGLAPPPSAPEPTVPPGSLAVAAVLGEQQKISALEFALEGDLGSTVDTVTLTLRESSQNGLNAGAEEAAIVACPVTDAFWIGEESGAWKRRPAFDCDLGQVPGSRDEDGVWTFELTTLAGEWLSTTRTAAPAVVLVSAAPVTEEQQPASFQVVFDGIEAEGIGLRAATTPPPDDESTGGAGTLPPAGGAAPSGGGGSAPDLGGDLGGSAPVADSGALPVDGGSPAEPAGDEGGAPVAAAADDTQLVAGQQDALPAAWYSGIGLPGAILLVLALAMAYAVMLALGPDAQPEGQSRRRGVSRALDRLAAARTAIVTARSRS